MIEKLAIYGFGSYFCGYAKFEDIDILIIHRSGDYESCRFAIRCKQFLASNIVEADITILSEPEEQQISFVAKSSARHIGKIYEEFEESDLRTILRKIRQVRMRDSSVNLSKERHDKQINLDVNSAVASFAPVI